MPLCPYAIYLGGCQNSLAETGRCAGIKKEENSVIDETAGIILLKSTVNPWQQLHKESGLQGVLQPSGFTGFSSCGSLALEYSQQAADADELK